MWFVAAPAERKERAAFGGLAWLKTLDLYSLTPISCTTLAKSLTVTFSEIFPQAFILLLISRVSDCFACTTNHKSKCLKGLYRISVSWTFQGFGAVWCNIYMVWFVSLFQDLPHKTLGFIESLSGLPEFCKPSLRQPSHLDEIRERYSSSEISDLFQN